MPETAMAQRFEQVCSGLSVDSLLSEIATCPELWAMDTWRQDYVTSAHRDTRSIMVRLPQSLWMPAHIEPINVFNDLTAEDMPALDALPSVRLLLDELIRATDALRIGRVMIVDLKAGGQITPHIDEGGYADHYDRFHICLQSDQGNVFSCGDDVLEPLHMRPGEAWWFNHKQSHACSNLSERPRIHLIVDLVAPKFRSLRCDGVSMQPELIKGLWPELEPLLTRHKDEIAHYPDIALNVDKATYEALEAAGKLRCYTARTLPDYELIGYEVCLVGPNLHYQDSIQAKQDVLYLAPEWRKGRLGLRLVDYADGMLRNEGTQVNYQHVKAKAGQNFGPALERMGYELVDLIYAKRLDR